LTAGSLGWKEEAKHQWRTDPSWDSRGPSLDLNHAIQLSYTVWRYSRFWREFQCVIAIWYRTLLWGSAKMKLKTNKQKLNIVRNDFRGFGK